MLSSICYNWRDYLCKERYLMIKRTFTADIETEIKIMITKDEYQILFSKGHNIHTQINHYYKITDDLTVRIRKMNNEFFLQYKVNNDGVQLKGLKDKTEYSMKLQESDYIVIKNNPETLWVYLKKENIFESNIVYEGTLETLRANVTLDVSMPDAEIDMNTYNGFTDYELEWEIDKKQYKKALKIMKNHGIDINDRVTGISKYKRLIQSYI